ncbi:hypothetical protein YPPY71_2046, partial [Yersinia pestis PY-71]
MLLGMADGAVNFEVCRLVMATIAGTGFRGG